MSSVRTETETVIKRILPYLRRRGYEPEVDIDFETPVKNLERYTRGYVDLLVTCGKATPYFVIEAKRNGRSLTKADAKQALDYGRAVKAPFVVVTNGKVVQVFNSHTGEPLHWNGRLADKVPSRDQVADVVSTLRRRKDATDVPLGKGDASLPFRPSLPLKQLNDLFARCHNKIRNIEKNEETAFADFSKILFLKLLEEKADAGDFTLPYTYRFWELAEKPAAQGDQVKASINQMLAQIRALGYGDVLGDDLHLKQPATFHYIVTELAKVSFTDSDHDVKGTAFEYFVRATLKGKKLGQYFTPRQVIDLMADLVGREAIVGAIRAGDEVRVLDPACGTGGFLVYMLKSSLDQVEDLYFKRKITKASRDTFGKVLMQDVFHGCDANEGVASAAKMNMIIAGDGHNNIRCENSVLPSASVWPMGDEVYDFIMTNPPFGTAEGDSLSRADAAQYPIAGGKGQHLFLQRMVLAAKPGGLICTVIDEGLLNTDTGVELRRWVMQHAELLAVVQLPDVTFKPNKITVRSSILMLRKREDPDIDLLATNAVTFAQVHSLGYHGTGELIRGFDFLKVRESLSAALFDVSQGDVRSGVEWEAFDVSSDLITSDATMRWDRKYWQPEVRASVGVLLKEGGLSLRDINTMVTRRGRSPQAATYVDEPEGFAVVVKAGSSITRFGEVTLDGADWIEKQVFDELPDEVKLQRNDVLLSSTGDGTLGKAAVWTADTPAIADGHITILRARSEDFDPFFLADYLRTGFGREQILRLYTGSTGLIELTTDHVDRVVVPKRGELDEQRALSGTLRSAEEAFRSSLKAADESLGDARTEFDRSTAG